MHQFRRGLTSRQSPSTARILLGTRCAEVRKKWAVSIDSIPLKIARRTLVVKAVGAQAPQSAQRRCWEPAVECSASTIVWPAPYVARTRTCAGDRERTRMWWLILPLAGLACFGLDAGGLFVNRTLRPASIKASR